MRWFWIILLVILVSCDGIDKEQVIGNYYLTTIDYVDVEKDLSYKLESGDFIGIVGPTVFAVGYNDEFIIAKQHPKELSNQLFDKSITNYFIIPIKKRIDQSPDENKIGPLTKIEFKQKRKELGISDDFIFIKVFKHLE